MLYVILATDVAESGPLRTAARQEHLAYVRELVEDGRLLIAGPSPAIDSPDPGPAGMSGNLIIAEFGSLEEARAWAAADPYTKAGVFNSVEIKPFVKVYP